MKRFLWVVLVATVICSLVGSSTRQAAGQAPDAWRQLSLPDFVREIEQLTSAAEPVSDALWTEIRSQSAERLLQAVQSGAQADYSDLVSLYLWARPNLTSEQSATVLAGLSPQANQASGWTFEKMRGVHAKMNQALLPKNAIHALSLAWLENRDVQTLVNVDHLNWLFQQIQIIDREETAAREFTVRWTGSVQAPASGQYTFSICPFDLNFKHVSMFRTQKMSLWIADNQILDSSQNGWTYKATPVTLAADQPTPIRIEFSYACSSRAVFEDRPAVALLLWERTGMTKRSVPTTALSTPDGSENGLLGEYVLTAAGSETNVSRVDPKINFIWYHGCLVMPGHADLRSRLAAQLYAVASAPGTLATWESEGQAQREEWMGAQWAFLESLDASRQEGWAGQLLAHPVLLKDCTRRAATDLYRRCRVAAPEAALQLVGQWAQAHGDEQPALATDYYQANREAYRDLARKMVWQYRPHLDALEQEYLELSDGRCSLPVAYTLSYGHWVEGRIAEWIDKLEARLADEQLSGDRRVNWLIARAQAEEIRRSPPDRNAQTLDRFLAGHGWLEEASLVAQSEAVRLRAFQELAARLAGNEQLAAAGQILDQAGKRCTSAESVAELSQWRSELETLSTAFQARHDQQEALARQAYVERLKARHGQAVDSGDEAAASRYEQLLSKAGAAIE